MKIIARVKEKTKNRKIGTHEKTINDIRQEKKLRTTEKQFK